MAVAEQRAAVVAEARSWLGTPYHHEADVRGAGIDCAMLIVRVFVDIGLVPAFDPRPYPQHWYLHRSEERYLGFIFDRAREVEVPEPGDVVMWRVGRCFSHGGIVTAWPPSGSGVGQMVVHAYAKARRVIESDVSLPGLFTSEKHPRRFFSYWRTSP
jgi:cell wall-associated NlpC family hydrolase